MGKFAQFFKKIGPHVGPILDSTLGIAGGVIQNRHQLKLQREQQNWNLQQWNRQNEYNHPLQQMSRLKEAGLNPHLIYGSNAGGAAGTAEEVKGYTPAQIQNVTKGMNTFGQMMNFRQIDARINNLESNTKVQDADAGLKKEQELTEATRRSLMALEGRLKAEQTLSESIKRAGYSIQNRQRAFNLYKESELFKYNAEAAALNVQNLQQELFTRRTKNQFLETEIRTDLRLTEAKIKDIFWQTQNRKSDLSSKSIGRMNTRLQMAIDRLDLQAKRQGWTFKDGLLQRSLFKLGRELLLNHSPDEAARIMIETIMQNAKRADSAIYHSLTKKRYGVYPEKR